MKTRMLALGALLCAATGCPDKGGAPTQPATAPGASTPAAPKPAAPAAAPPAVVRGAVPDLPLEAPIDRGTKPAASPELLAKGKQLYASNCAVCHGPDGKGDGPAAFAAQPRPRNFSKGIFKVHTNDNGSLPLDEDLFDVLTRGIGDTAMPPFERLSPEDRWALVEHVKELSVYRDDEEDPPIEVRFFKERPAGPRLDIGQPRPATPELLAVGKTAYLKLDCNKCHGANGDGNGPSATELKDDWGEEIWPRSFQDGEYRYAPSIRDVIHRFTTGLSGTPMAAFGGTQLTDEERWGLGHYLLSLRTGQPQARPAPEGRLVASRSAQPIPSNLRQARFWHDVPVHEVALSGDGPKTARVAVQRDASRLAVVVAYDDAACIGRAAAVEDFQDVVTLTLGAATKSEWVSRDGKVEERGPAPAALEGSGKWMQRGEWRVLFVRPLAGLPLEGQTVSLSIQIDDKDASGVKTSRTPKPLELTAP